MHFSPIPYLDPSSGSILIQMLIAALAGVSVAAYSSWNVIKGWFGIKSKPKDEDEDDTTAE